MGGGCQSDCTFKSLRGCQTDCCGTAIRESWLRMQEIANQTALSLTLFNNSLNPLALSINTLILDNIAEDITAIITDLEDTDLDVSTSIEAAVRYRALLGDENIYLQLALYDVLFCSCSSLTQDERDLAAEALVDAIAATNDAIDAITASLAVLVQIQGQLALIGELILSDDPFAEIQAILESIQLQLLALVETVPAVQTTNIAMTTAVATAAQILFDEQAIDSCKTVTTNYIC